MSYDCAIQLTFSVAFRYNAEFRVFHINTRLEAIVLIVMTFHSEIPGIFRCFKGKRPY